ncbi:MAG: glycoside hydrolase family 127 protein [Bryobacterales bacterium]|nr:glycoside hydrolase family 127 protein [Bryobacterales bacterium]
MKLWFALFTVAFAADWKDQAVIHLESSPHALLKPVPVRAVTFTPGFWQSRQKVTAESSLPSLLALLEQNGYIDNFRRLKNKDLPRRGPLYTDSDVYKWMEAAAWALHTGPHPQLESRLNELIELVLSVQEPSGYLNTWHIGDREKQRFQLQETNHELYCLGHWLQAGYAVYRYNGDRRLLDAGAKFVDYLLTIGGPGKQPLLTGHPELELALAELYRITGEKKYLDFAAYLFSGVEKDRLKITPQRASYMFSGIPFTSRDKFEGHAVRALYAATGAADYWLETGDAAYKKTLDTLWRDLVSSKMFVTGGVGSRAAGETFGDAYELPNRQAYTESCAAIANWIFQQRLLAGSGNARYTAVMERALYNGINSGMSLSGNMYCYRNPLASAGEKIRNPWYNTLCCPPNLQRTFMSLGGYFYSTSKDNGLWLHFYDSHRLDWRLPSGAAIKAEMKTGMPWRGDVQYTLTPASATSMTLHLRIPEWSLQTKVSINGVPYPGKVAPNTYLALKRTWKPGDVVTMSFDMTPHRVAANPRVPETYGKVSIQRGPFLYCLEQPDVNGASVFDIFLNPGAPLNPVTRKDKFEGEITVLESRGLSLPAPATGAALYTYGQPAQPIKPLPLTLVPYYTFNNRGDAPFTVWLPQTK